MPTKPKGLEVDSETLEMIARVRTFEADIKSFASRLKTLLEQKQEIVENTNEYDAVLKVQEALAEANDKLRTALSSKDGYNDLLESIGEEREALSSARRNLSDFLLGYFHKTGERQIEIANHKAREVILSGRLGKEKDYQTSIFAPINTNEGRKDLE